MFIYRSLQSQEDEPPEDIKKSTQLLLRSLLTITQTFGTLPAHAEVTMRLVYYDDGMVYINILSQLLLIKVKKNIIYS